MQRSKGIDRGWSDSSNSSKSHPLPFYLSPPYFSRVSLLSATVAAMLRPIVIERAIEKGQDCFLVHFGWRGERIYEAILESGMGCKSCLSVDREISRGKRVKWVNLFELDGVFDTLFIHLSQCVKLSDSREMEELKRREISIIFYRHRCNRLIFFARYSEGILYLFQRVCVYLCRIAEKKALERNAASFISHRYIYGIL